MKLLGIDFGLAHVGLAISDGPLAEPYSQIDYHNRLKMLTKIRDICLSESIEKIVIGLPDGEVDPEVRVFAADLKNLIDLPIELVDETLSSQEATGKLFDAKVSMKKRRSSQHQTAAAIILQNYLDDITL